MHIQLVEQKNLCFNFSRIEEMGLSFNISSVYVDTNGEAQCYQFFVEVSVCFCASDCPKFSHVYTFASSSLLCDNTRVVVCFLSVMLRL